MPDTYGTLIDRPEVEEEQDSSYTWNEMLASLRPGAAATGPFCVRQGRRACAHPERLRHAESREASLFVKGKGANDVQPPSCYDVGGGGSCRVR